MNRRSEAVRYARKIILVRHGETDWNPINRIQGHLDIPLNNAGILQAQKLAEELKNERIDVIYTSPLARALKTAEIINASHNVTLLSEPLIAEIDQGKWNGLTVAEARKRYPTTYRKWQENPLAASPPKGESILTVVKRNKTFLEKISRCDYSNILVVSHKVSCAVLKILIKKQAHTLKMIKPDLQDLWNRLFYNAQAEVLPLTIEQSKI